MNARLLLPASIVIATVAALCLVFCRHEEPEAPSGTKKVVAKPAPSVVSPDGVPSAVKPRPQPQGKVVLPSEPEPPLSAREEEKKASRMASSLYKWMLTWAMEHGGAFPPDTSALFGANLGFPEDEAKDWLGRIIEYRGRELTNSDAGYLVLMRYRIPNFPDKEVRVHVSGSVMVVPVTDPIREDTPPPPQ